MINIFKYYTRTLIIGIGKLIIILIPLIIYLSLIHFYFWPNLISKRNDTVTSDEIKILLTSGATFASAFTALIGVIFTINNNQNLKNKELLNSLDQKSEWRKELMNIAAKPVMQLEDVYRILASLRFLPKDEEEIKKSKQKEFDEISKEIYCELIKMTDCLKTKVRFDNKINLEEYKFSIENSEIIRQYAKFLLKHHWEFNQSEKEKKKFMEKEKKEFEKVKFQLNKSNEKTGNDTNINVKDSKVNIFRKISYCFINKPKSTIYISFILSNVMAFIYYIFHNKNEVSIILDKFNLSGISYAFLIACGVTLFTLVKDYRDNMKEIFYKLDRNTLERKKDYMNELGSINKIVGHMTILLLLVIIIGIVSYTVNFYPLKLIYEFDAICVLILQLVCSWIISNSSADIHRDLVTSLQNE